jgi:anti-sigma regulatory factor (Ser/Thr protein kinase)
LRELALHLLDIAENSVSANARNIHIEVIEDLQNDRLHMSVSDDGRGMDAETVAKVTDPFVTSRTTRRVGLGIPLLKAAAEACKGYLTIQSEPGKGTHVAVEFEHSHIDRMPLGDIGGTFLTLLIGSPGVHWVFTYRVNGSEFVFDDQEIKETLDGMSMTEPTVLKFIREYIVEGITEVRATALTYSK